ncbi:hypothetical protein ACFL0W_01445 [Nanoarchaeota archaeon]
MDFDKFFEEFKQHMYDTDMEKVLYDDMDEKPNKEDVNVIEIGTFTYLFNVAMYNLAKANNLYLTPENATGRGGYSDILLTRKNGEILFEIEHENDGLARSKDPETKKHNLLALNKSLRNLLDSEAKAKYKVLITYTFDNLTAEQLKERCETYLKEHNKNNSTIYLIYADNEYENALTEFQKEILFPE